MGNPVEFTSWIERKKDPVQEMRAYGIYHQHFGTWSDDSSLTFCLMDSLTGGYNINDIADKFCKYCYKSYWTPFFLKSSLVSEKIKIIEEVSSLTHAHKRSKLACVIYVEYAINLLNGNNKMEALMNTIGFIKEHCTEEYHEELKKFSRILDGSIASFNENQIKSSGYVIDALEAALCSFITTDSYADSIIHSLLEQKRPGIKG